MKDLRLYYYQNGRLTKWSNKQKQYRFTNMEDIEYFIDNLHTNKKSLQWVVVEYFEDYVSKIIKIY